MADLEEKKVIEAPKKEKKTKKKAKKEFKIPKFLKETLITLAVLALIFVGIMYSEKLTHRETLLSFGFKDVGELVTQEWYGRILEDSSKDRKLFNKVSIPFTTSRIIFSLDVEVQAGINFKDIEYEFSKDYKTITITLPETKIYKYYQVPNTFRSYLDDESWFTNIDSKERHELEDAVVEKGKEEALAAGLLEKANKNAKVLIEQMIRAKNKDIKIEWKDTE